PAFDSGFLADDYYVGERVAERAARSSDAADLVRRTFAEPWSDRFEVFRPTVMLTIEADYALYGPDGRRHHRTNFALWCAVALASAAVAYAADGRRRTSVAAYAFAFAAVGAGPAEAMGWLVAREDLLFALFALLAVRSRLAFRASPARSLPWLALAL